MLIGLLIGIIVLVVLVLKTKIHAFLALIMSAVIIGLVGGMPMVNVTLENGKTLGIINSITTGFGGTLGSIGIIIGFGVMMGQIFERTGAAKRMAQTFLKLFGKGREEEALGITGFLVSIPIFCDSGFVILAPIAKAISKVTKISDFHWESHWRQVSLSPIRWYLRHRGRWASAVFSESMWENSSCLVS